jgi:hypothetical protein
MKKTVITFGVISGLIISILMLGTLFFVDRIGFEYGMVLGYTTMVLSFLMVFFGIRSYRETVGGGRISFGRAFSVGILIMLISCAFYVITWEFMYIKMFPDFADKYAAHILEKARAAGKKPEEIEALTKEMQDFKVMYDKPLFNIGMTLLEPLPVGVPITLVSAGLLRKKRKDEDEPANQTHEARTQSALD